MRKFLQAVTVATGLGVGLGLLDGRVAHAQINVFGDSYRYVAPYLREPAFTTKPAVVGTQARLTSTHDGIVVQATFAGSTVVWNGQRAKTVVYEGQVSRVELLANGKRIEIRTVSPALNGGTSFTVPISSFTQAERAKPILLQVNVYESAFKPAGTSKSVALHVPPELEPIYDIQWEPQQLQLEAAQDTAQQATVRFTSKTAIQNASVRINPSLKGIVSVDTAIHHAVEAGSTTEVPLTAVIPAGMPAGEYNGRLELLANGKIIAKLPIELVIAD